MIFSLSAFKGNIIVCFLFLSLLAACVPSIPGTNTGASEIGDGGFLSGEPCGPPCFMSIVPGVTTEAEAIQTLQSKGLCRTYTTYNHEASSGRRGFYCPFHELEIAFQPDTDVVEVVSFRPSQKVTMEDVIARYGEPDAVLVTVRHQYPRTGMLLKYAEIRFDVVLAEQEGSIFKVDASTEVERIAYLSLAAYSSARPTIDSLPTWKGYGEYQEYIPRGQ